MRLVDLHNVYMSALLLACVVFVGLAAPVDWKIGIVVGVVTFLTLGGRVLTHGLDLAQTGKRWRAYVSVNSFYNAGVGLAAFLVMAMIGLFRAQA